MLVDSLAADAARGNGSRFSLFSWEHSQGILGRQWLVSVADTVRYTHVGLSPGSCSNTDLQRGEKSLRSNGVGPRTKPRPGGRCRFPDCLQLHRSKGTEPVGGDAVRSGGVKCPSHTLAPATDSFIWDYFLVTSYLKGRVRQAGLSCPPAQSGFLTGAASLPARWPQWPEPSLPFAGV